MEPEKPREVNVKIGCFVGSVRKSFAIHLVALSLIGFNFILLSLQTSLSVEDGLGATSLSLHFAVTFVAAILTPACLQFVNVKTGLLIGDLGAVVYCLSNIYPKAYILLPGNIIYGIGKACFWITSGSYVVFYAKLFAKATGNTHEAYYNKCSAYLIAATTSSQIFGSLVMTFIFKTDFEPSDTERYGNTSAGYNSTILTATTPTYRVSDHCGSKDCQVSEIIESFTSNYKPTSQLAVYLVMGLFSFLSTIALLLHAFFAPLQGTVFKNDEETESKKKLDRAASIYKPMPMDKVHFQHPNECNLHTNNDTDPKPNHEKAKTSSFAKCTWKNISFNNSSNCVKFTNEIKETLKQFTDRNQLLLMGMQFFAGFNKSFQFGDLTRAYTSCVYGVAQIGIGLALYNAAVCLCSFPAGKAASIFGRKVSICVAFCVHLALLLFCLFWVPHENSSTWIIYALYLFYGAVDSVWFSTILASVASFFPDNSSRGYCCYISFITLANVVGFSISTSVCVYTKIYLQITVLCTAVAMQLLAERKLSQARKCAVCDDNEIKISG